MHPSTPRRSSGHFQRNFDTSNYGGLGSDRSIPGPNGRTEERRTDNRLRSRRRLGPSAVSACVCLPPQRFSPWGAFQDKRFCVSLHVYTSLLPPLIPHRRLISAPCFKQGSGESRAGWRGREKRQCLVKREREKTALQRRQTAGKHSGLCRRATFDGFCVLMAKTLRQTRSKGRSFCTRAAQSLP